METTAEKFRSRVAFVFTVLFGLTFVLFGLTGTFLLYVQDRSWDHVAVGTLAATVFGTIGLSFLSTAFTPKPQTLRAAEVPLHEPWRKRADWASGSVRPTMPGTFSAIATTVVTLYWLVSTYPLLEVLPEVFRTEHGSAKWLLLAFPVIDAGLVALALQSVFRICKFGDSVFVMSSVPGVVGGELAGVVRIPRSVRPETGFRLKLSCTDESKCGNAVEKHVAWDDERLVLHPLRGAVIGQTDVPVQFTIPHDCPESARAESTAAEWLLEVSARLPGVNYFSSFVVPVYKNVQCTRIQAAEGPSDTSKHGLHSELVLCEAGIRKESLPGQRVRLTFRAARHWSLAVALTAVFALFLGFIWQMLSFDAPILFPIVFGIGALMFAKQLLNLWFFLSVIEACPDGLSIRGGLFGFGRTHFVPANELDDFGTNDGPWTDLYAVLRSGEELTLAKGITSRLVERAVFHELDTALGRPCTTVEPS